jgi:esterase/lipase
MKIRTEDNFTLDAEFNNVNSHKGIIFAHGMTVDRDDEGIFVRAESKLNKIGFSTMRFDFRAHGKSQGDSVKDFTISGEIKDLNAVVNYFNNQGVRNIGLAGASFGGSISALYASKYPKKLAALFLANPCLNYEKCFIKPTTIWAKKYFKNVLKRINEDGSVKIGSQKFQLGHQLFDEMKHYNPCRELNKFKNPLFIVHGDKDSKVNFNDVVNCFKSLSKGDKELRILHGAEHGFHNEPFETQVEKMIVNFFKDKLLTKDK